MRPRRLPSAILATLALMAVLAACGDGGETPSDDPLVTSPTAAPTHTGAEPTAEPDPDVTVLEFEIVDGRATPPLGRAAVEIGTTVRIVATSDQPDELHLHGYDLLADIGPGEEGVIEFVADQAGLFELETHDAGLILLQLEVR